MLARTFKTATELGIPEEIYGGLVEVLGRMERGELVHVPSGSLQIVDPYIARLPDTGFNVARLPDTGFNMAYYETPACVECGTACCICGWTALVTGMSADQVRERTNYDPALDDLFVPSVVSQSFAELRAVKMHSITVGQAAEALRNYLTEGQARWSDIVRPDQIVSIPGYRSGYRSGRWLVEAE